MPRVEIAASIHRTGNDVSRGHPGVGVEPGLPDGVVVVPHRAGRSGGWDSSSPRPCCLRSRTVGFTRPRARGSPRRRTEAPAVSRVALPVERPAVAGPGDQPAVEVDRRPVLSVSAVPRARDGGVVREDVGRRQRGIERECGPACPSWQRRRRPDACESPCGRRSRKACVAGCGKLRVELLPEDAGGQLVVVDARDTGCPAPVPPAGCPRAKQRHRLE